MIIQYNFMYCTPTLLYPDNELSPYLSWSFTKKNEINAEIVFTGSGLFYQSIEKILSDAKENESLLVSMNKYTSYYSFKTISITYDLAKYYVRAWFIGIEGNLFFVTIYTSNDVYKCVEHIKKNYLFESTLGEERV